MNATDLLANVSTGVLLISEAALLTGLSAHSVLSVLGYMLDAVVCCGSPARPFSE